MAFVWNRTAGKLHLDLNRDLDLTDDPAGMFGCPEKNYSRNYQTFTNIHLSFKTPAGSRQVLADLKFWDYGSRPNCTAAMRSFWQGRVVLQGIEWQAGVVEDPFDKAGFPEGSYLLLRSLDGPEQIVQHILRFVGCLSIPPKAVCSKSCLAVGLHRRIPRGRFKAGTRSSPGNPPRWAN